MMTTGSEYRTLIDAAALDGAIRSGSVFVVDCSFDLGDPAFGRQTYLDGHVPTAVHLDLDHDLSDPQTGDNGRHPLPDPDRLADTLRRLGLRRGAQVVAYDSAGGQYAARLWWLLRWMGHDAVAILDGGKTGWVRAGYLLESGEPLPRPAGDFAAGAIAHDRTISADTLLATLDGTGPLVVDARAPGRYLGEPNPLDPVAGRIPGARNRFFMDNLSPDGSFKPPAVLQADYAKVLAGRDSEDAVLQCGSGVTACHNLLAMEIAGLSGARLYPGSWSEWISDPARPIETGPADRGG